MSNIMTPGRALFQAVEAGLYVRVYTKGAQCFVGRPTQYDEAGVVLETGDGTCVVLPDAVEAVVVVPAHRVAAA